MAVMDSKHAAITSKSAYLIENVVGCGPFQVILFTSVFGLSMLSISFVDTFMTFGLYSTGWRCLDVNGSHYDVITTSPAHGDVLDRNHSNASVTNNHDYITEGHCSLFDSCSRIEFKPGTSTIVTEWGLLCDKAWIAKMIISLQYAGKLFGSTFAGYLGDRLGRKTTIYGAQAFVTVLNVVSIFSTSWQMFAALRFLTGMAAAVVLIFYYVYTVEFVTMKWRGPIPNIPYWPLVCILFSLTCWWLKDWRDVMTVAAVISGVSMLPALYLPESPRWFEAKNKKAEFERTFRKIAKMNGKTFPPMTVADTKMKKDDFGNAAYDEQNEESGKSVVENGRGTVTNDTKAIDGQKNNKEEDKNRVDSANDDETRYNIFHIFTPAYRKYTLLLGFPRFAVSLIFFALGFGVKELSGDFYINIILMFAFEFPLSPVIAVLPNVIGRKLSGISLSSCSGVCLLAAACCHHFTSGYSSTTGVLVLAIGARVTISSFWGVLMTYTAEIYPTVVRGLGASWGNIMIEIGGIVAPFLIPDTESSFFICYVVMSGIAILCTCVVFALPETKGRKLKDNFDQNQESLG